MLRTARMDPDDPDNMTSEEKAAQEKTAKTLAAPQTRSEDLRRRLLGMVLLLCTVVFGLGVWTLGSVFRQVVSTGPIEDESAPVAVATSCEQLGPVSRFGFGYWWECLADVHSHGATSRGQEFHGSELTPADIGKPVHATATSTGSPRDSSTLWQRNTTRPLAFMQFVSFLVAFLPFLYLLVQGLMRVMPLWMDLTIDKDRYRKYYAKYAREGRLSPQEVRDLTPKKKKKKEEPPPPPPPGVPIDPPPPAQASEQYPPPYQPGPGQQPSRSYGNQPGGGW